MCPIGVPSFGSRSLWISNTRSAGEKSGFPRSMSRSNGPPGSNTVTCVSPGARVAPNDTIGAPTSTATRAGESTATIARFQDLVILPLPSVIERSLLVGSHHLLERVAVDRDDPGLRLLRRHHIAPRLVFVVEVGDQPGLVDARLASELDRVEQLRLARLVELGPLLRSLAALLLGVRRLHQVPHLAPPSGPFSRNDRSTCQDGPHLLPRSLTA